MRPVFVLLHSPALGQRSWQPVATALGLGGEQVLVPSLAGVAQGEPPYWPLVLDSVRERLRRTNPDRPAVLVPHSNAGVFVPLLATGLEVEVRGSIFVDATLPVLSGETPTAPEGALPFLRNKAVGGRLPPWTDWWDDQDIAELFPDEATRLAVAAEQPRLPLTYFEESLPVPARWDHQACAYIQFSPPYDDHAAQAGERGWRVEHLPGGHLHMLVEPHRVADLLARIADQTGMSVT